MYVHTHVHILNRYTHKHKNTYHTYHVSIMHVHIPNVLKLLNCCVCKHTHYRLNYTVQDIDPGCNCDQKTLTCIQADECNDMAQCLYLQCLHNTRTMMVMYCTLCLATYLTACWSHLRIMHLEPPNVPLFRCSKFFLGKTNLFVTLEPPLSLLHCCIYRGIYCR